MRGGKRGQGKEGEGAYWSSSSSTEEQSRFDDEQHAGEHGHMGRALAQRSRWLPPSCRAGVGGWPSVQWGIRKLKRPSTTIPLARSTAATGPRRATTVLQRPSTALQEGARAQSGSPRF